VSNTLFDTGYTFQGNAFELAALESHLRRRNTQDQTKITSHVVLVVLQQLGHRRPEWLD
jgi:hypothetical protein